VEFGTVSSIYSAFTGFDNGVMICNDVGVMVLVCLAPSKKCILRGGIMRGLTS